MLVIEVFTEVAIGRIVYVVNVVEAIAKDEASSNPDVVVVKVNPEILLIQACVVLENKEMDLTLASCHCCLD